MDKTDKETVGVIARVKGKVRYDEGVGEGGTVCVKEGLPSIFD